MRTIRLNDEEQCTWNRRTGRPSRDTGLPPGVEVGPLGRRFLAYLIDLLVPGGVGIVIGSCCCRGSPSSDGCCSASAARPPCSAGRCWSGSLLAERAATPGMRAMKLQLVGLLRRPADRLGPGTAAGDRALPAAASGIGLVIMLVLLVLHPRQQGWHDLVVQAVMIKERVLAPPRTQKSARSRAAGRRLRGRTQQPRHGLRAGAGRGAPARSATGRRPATRRCPDRRRSHRR